MSTESNEAPIASTITQTMTQTIIPTTAPKTIDTAKDILTQGQKLLSELAYEELKTYFLSLSESTLSTWSTEELFERSKLLSQVYFLTQKFNSSSSYAQEMLELAATLSNTEKSKAHYQVAINYYELGATQSTLDNALIAYDLSDKNDPAILNIIGAVHYRREDYTEAQLWYERGLEICKDATDKKQLHRKALMLKNLSFIYFDLGDYEKSLDYSLEALSVIPSSYSLSIAKLHYDLVATYVKCHDLENAEKSFKNGYELETSLGSKRCTQYYISHATLLEAQENFTKAETILLGCIDYLSKNNTCNLSEAYKQLKELYEKQGDFERALKISDLRYQTMIKQLNHDFDKQTNFFLSKVKHDLVMQEREFYRKQSHVLTESLNKAQTLAQTDALTGLHNRAYLKSIAQILFDSAQKIQQPLSILLIDIDHFKSVNDTYGHLKGDEVLRKVALIMKDNLRKEDVLARYGGEEFIVFVPNSSVELALIVAEKIRVAIESYDWSTIAEGLSLTASIGIHECQDSLDLSLEQADIKLYNAKGLGRNCCVHELK